MRSSICFILCCLLSSRAFGQVKLRGQFEHRYFTEDGFGEVFTIDFFEEDSFHLTRFHDQGDIDYTEKISAIYKIKRDTLILISPLPEIYFTTLSNNSVSDNQFIYLIDKMKPYLSSLSFFFLDKEFNLIQVNPIDIRKVADTAFKNEIRYKELFYKFDIPEDASYFMAKTPYLLPSVTFDVAHIKGKLFTDKNISKDKSLNKNPENYIDLTFDRYLINRKRTKFSSLTKHPGPVGELITQKFLKK